MGIGRGTEGSEQGLRDLRAARRRRYVEDLDVMDLLYRAYVALIFGAIGLGILAGAIHDAPLTPRVVDDIAAKGPALLGLGIALTVLAGLRSGSHGGPLAIEEADVQYVLLAPVDRGTALRPGALRQLRTWGLAGGVLGAIVGNFLFRRMPGSGLEWIGFLAAFGVLVPVAALGSALLAAGRRLTPMTASTIGGLLFAWTLGDLLLDINTSPATLLGLLATEPLQGGSRAWLGAGGAALALLTAGFGLSVIGKLSLDAARRRAKLTAVLRFSASVKDVRSVVLLRRQLASEGSRRRPWVRLRNPRLASHPILRRGWQSLFHWPLARIVRTVVLGVAAGMLCAGAWDGTTPLLVLPGIVLLIAALDLVEPLAQEFDHPLRRDLLPSPPASLARRHLLAPSTAMLPIALIAALSALALGASSTTIGLAAVMLVPTALVLICCAAFSLTTDPYANLLAPGVAEAMVAIPLLVATLAVGLPIFVARHGAEHGRAVIGAAISTEFLILIAAAAMGWMVGSRALKGTEVRP